MNYSSLTIDYLKDQFQLHFIEDETLFPTPPTQPILEDLQHYLDKYLPLALAIDTEKARSEYIIAPILGELKMSYKEQISLFSGIDFNVDQETGLSGRCDYIISKSSQQYSLTAPIVMMVEAKNDNIKSGIAQCAGEMIGAQKFNESKKNAIPSIYGCISNGTNWKFLKLQNQTLWIDPLEYYINNLSTIMGILIEMSLN